ncbi:MAG: hypothetical protein RIQ93_1751 [Verrucomicrobiota bacterium]
MTPHNMGLRVAKATLLTRTGRRDEAVLEWQWLLAHAEPELVPAVVRSYAQQLIAAGWWPELTRLALQHLHSAHEPTELWTLLACESLRLSGGSADPAAIARIHAGAERAIVAAYAAYAAKDEGAARRHLAEIDSTVRCYSSALLAARLWLLIKEERQARQAFFRLGRSLTADELATQELLFASLHSRVGVRTAQTLLKPAMTLAEWEGGLTRIVVHGLDRADPAVARELTSRLREQVRRLSPASLVAAWLYCGAAGDEQNERFWRQPLESSAGLTLPNLAINRPSSAVLRILIGRVPLSFDLIYSVMAASPPPASAPPARSPLATRDARPSVLTSD